MDPAEWAAKLEDMYHNNAFKAPEVIIPSHYSGIYIFALVSLLLHLCCCLFLPCQAIPEKYPATEVTVSK